MSPFSSLILLIWIFSPCLLVNWIKCCWFYWFSQRTNMLSHWFFLVFLLLVCLLVCFYFIGFSPELGYLLLPILLGVIYSFCSRAFRCAFKLLIWISLIFLCRYFVLWICLLELLSLCPISLGMLCFHFYSILEFIISGLTYFSFNRELFSFHVVVAEIQL